MRDDGSFAVAEIAELSGVSAATVRRWIHEGRLSATKTDGSYWISRDDNQAFILDRLHARWSRSEEPWVPRDLAAYDDWHTVLDELVWLLKVTYADRDSLKRRDFRLDHLLQRHLEANVVSLPHVATAFLSASAAPVHMIEEDLRRAWYNELAFSFPLRSSTIGLAFRDVEVNKKDADVRLTFPSWRFIQAYYAVYFYVRCLCLMKMSSFKLERHAATLNTFDHCVLPACERVFWPWPLSIRHVPGRRVKRATLPVQQFPHLRYGYASHPRPPHRTPLQSYEYVRGQLRRRARGRGSNRTYSVVDFLYDFRVWANYQDIDSLLSLWGSGYRSIIDMNLSTVLSFVGAAVELAFASMHGEEAYLGQLQHLYDTFIWRDADLRIQFPSTSLFQRLQIFRGTGFIGAGIRLVTEENPHAVEILRRHV